MADQLPVNIQMGALPPRVRWTPQQLADAMVARMRLVTAQTFSLFVSGSTEPGSNVGPWLKNGTEWYVWSDTAGAYVPITIPSGSLGYYIGPTTPDQNETNFWIETDAFGSPLALKIYYSGAWVDVYATTLAAYLTIANAALTYAPLASPALTGTPTVPTAAPGTNTTQAASTAFVQAAVAGVVVTPFAAYPAQGVAAAQTVPVDNGDHVIEFSSAPINPAPAPFDTGAFKYVAPAAGYYRVDFTSQFDNVDGAAATMEVVAGLEKNGSPTNIGDTDGTPSPNGARWSPGFSGIIQLAANDELTVVVRAADGVNTGDITLTNAQLSVTREQAV